MVLLKSIASIYLAVHLLLPGCICQILSAFGCEVHHHHDHHRYSESHGRSLEFSAGPHGFSPECHCDEHCPKFAELAGNDESGVPEGVVASSVDFDIRKFPVATHTVSFRPRGPPSAPRWSLAPYSGVFRL